MNKPNRLPSLTTILPSLAKACAAGVALVITGRVSGIEPVIVVGGALMAPFTILAGLACLFIVLMAPAWPFSALSDKVPDRLGVPFMVVTVVATLAWWALWGFIATGALSDH